MLDLTKPLILDGATGTRLQQLGMPPGVCTELWVLEHPEALRQLQREYLQAGAQVLYAPTFGANRIRMREYGVTESVAQFNRRLVALTRDAAEGRALVAGDLAPTGRLTAPLGDLAFEELVDVYREQAQALEDAGVDLFAAETLMSLTDARAAVLGIRAVSQKPIFVSLTVEPSGRTLYGTDPCGALMTLQRMGVAAVGLNCSTGPEAMLPVLKKMAAYAEVPLLAKPNAGLPEQTADGFVYHCPPEEFTALVEEMAACGVAAFGGCCGSGAEHIAALVQRTQGLTPAAPAAPALAGMLPCATEKAACPIPLSQQAEDVVPCDEDLLDSLMETETLLTVELTEAGQLEDLAQAAYGAQCAVCFRCEDGALLEQALRLFQGTALYEGGLPDAALLPLVRRYGLIVR